jgi:hypothetical protein
MRAEEFGRVHHLPTGQPAAVVDGLRGRGHVDGADELDELIAGLEPIAAAVSAADD